MKTTIKKGKKSITISEGMQKGKHWLGLEDGEGGDFSDDDLYDALLKFYEDRF